MGHLLQDQVSLVENLITDDSVYYNRGEFRAALNLKNLFDVRHFIFLQSLNSVISGASFTVLGTVSWQF